MPPRPPYLPDGNQNRYHHLIWAGVSNEEACRALGVKSSTGRQWRKRLRRQASAYLGRDDVEYQTALRLLLDRERIEAQMSEKAA